MLPQEKALVRRVDNDRVLRQSALIQIVQQTADILVDAFARQEEI